jgi:hypothetical protein
MEEANQHTGVSNLLAEQRMRLLQPPTSTTSALAAAAPAAQTPGDARRTRLVSLLKELLDTRGDMLKVGYQEEHEDMQAVGAKIKKCRAAINAIDDALFANIV